MDALVEKIVSRLRGGAYANEAAVSVGVILPILRALGWDDADPHQLVPEYSVSSGRVDFALFGATRKPSVFIEAKGVGRNTSGDRQLFEYAFHQGVPICVLTDGREWSFFYPAGEGDYSERRVQKLNLLEREPRDIAEVLKRYLSRERVHSGEARDAVDLDFRDLRARRDAQRSIPRAWHSLVEEPEDLLIELVQDQTENISGRRPTASSVSSFLRSLNTVGDAPKKPKLTPKLEVARRSRQSVHDDLVSAEEDLDKGRQDKKSKNGAKGHTLTYWVYGEERQAKSAKEVLVDVLSDIARKNPSRISEIAKRSRGRTRNHIARSPSDIYPKRPDLARAEEIYDGWLVGLNISNRDKMRIIRTACEVCGIEFGHEIRADLPNA
ncbi:hypothetical protein [Alloyangia pacifica]|uniref:hypothetical protein n=1 Tax=Alloyangia pacifica TaxID=311180 RepID=UPI001CD5BC6E|nr:hypothetical protein [Alloyangia pacifica]MCA0993964.1 hypothetical protein [Alloyangia pacifica]